MATLSQRTRSARGRGRSGCRRVATWFRLQVALAVGGLTLLVAAGLSQAASAPTLLAARRSVPAASPTVEQTRFIGRVGRAAQRFHATVGLPPSLVTAMAINETGWGDSELNLQANNYFGIKADAGEGPNGSVVYDTREVIDGRVVVVRAPFRAYHSLEDSVRDLGIFLHSNARYDALWARADDPRASAVVLAQAGDATDPAWAGKLIGLIDGFDLETLDAPTWLPDWLLGR